MLIAVYPAYKHLGLAGGGQVAALLAIIVRYRLQVMRVRGLRGLKLLRWRRRIPAGGMSPSDCPECRTTKVEAGRVVCTCMRKWGISNRVPRFSMKTVASAGDRQSRVVETDFASDPRRNPLVKGHPDGLIFHHSLWLEALRREFEQDSLFLGCEDQEGESHRSLLLVYARGLPFGISHIGKRATGRRPPCLRRHCVVRCQTAAKRVNSWRERP